MTDRTADERDAAISELVTNLTDQLPDLIALRDRIAEWTDAKCVYRFLHQSFKVFEVQSATADIIAAFERLAPTGVPFSNDWARHILDAGVGHTFTLAANRDWLATTLPIVNGYQFARHLLDVTIDAADTATGEGLLSQAWATVLYLYGLR